MVVLGPPAAGALADGLAAALVAGAADGAEALVAGAAAAVVFAGAAADVAAAGGAADELAAGVAADFELEPHAVASRVVAASALANTRRLDTALSMDPPVALHEGGWVICDISPCNEPVQPPGQRELRKRSHGVAAHHATALMALSMTVTTSLHDRCRCCRRASERGRVAADPIARTPVPPEAPHAVHPSRPQRPRGQQA